MKAGKEPRPGVGPVTRSGAYPAAVAALRTEVLRALRGTIYQTIREIPRRWPVQRVHVAAVVRMLRDEGFVEEVADPRNGRTPAYRATAAGLRSLAALDAAPRAHRRA
ncbi:MAG: winged helix DNA-binding protein [Gemmatimonadota bacterium]